MEEIPAIGAVVGGRSAAAPRSIYACDSSDCKDMPLVGPRKNTALWCPSYAKAVTAGRRDNHYRGERIKPHRQSQIQGRPCGIQPGIYPVKGGGSASGTSRGADVCWV